MSVAQPTHLLTLNEASGTSITNHGTAGTAFTIQQGASGTNFIWHQDAGSYDGYYEGVTNSGSSMPYATTTGTQSGALADIKFACRFQVRSLNNSIASILGRGASNKGMRVRAASPAGSGDFDLQIVVESVGFAQTRSVTISALSFNTDYALACALKTGTPASTEIRAKLDAAAVVSSGTQDWGGDSLDTEQIAFLKPDDFTDIRGFDGFMHYWAYDRGGTAWSDSDFADINTSPKATIGGWPGGPGAFPGLFSSESSGLLGPGNVFGQMFRRMANGLLIPLQKRIFLPNPNCASALRI